MLAVPVPESLAAEGARVEEATRHGERCDAGHVGMLYRCCNYEPFMS